MPTNLLLYKKCLKFFIFVPEKVCLQFFPFDKQLMPLKSRGSFITFMPKKPEKYGIKFWVYADVHKKCNKYYFVSWCTKRKMWRDIFNTISSHVFSTTSQKQMVLAQPVTPFYFSDFAGEKNINCGNN